METRALKQAVKRNITRFPPDFLIELTTKDIDFMVSQNVIPSKSYFGGATPFAFTEQGVAMLSSVLRSRKAIDVNIAIMRAFVLLRQHLSDYKDLKEKIEKLEREMNRKFKDINDVLSYLLNPKSKPKEIGFRQKGRST